MRACAWLLLIFLLSSCGIFRKVQKESSSSLTEVRHQESGQTAGVVVDRSITTTRELSDTAVTIPAKTVKQETVLNMDSLIQGMTAIKNDLVDVRLLLNPVTGILSAQATVHPQVVPIHLNRVITKQNDITSNTNSTTQAKSFAKAEAKSNKVDRTPKNTFWFVILGVGIAAVITFAVYRYFKG